MTLLFKTVLVISTPDIAVRSVPRLIDQSSNMLHSQQTPYPILAYLSAKATKGTNSGHDSKNEVMPFLHGE